VDVTVTTNAGAMVANLAARAAALRNLRPVLKDIAAEVDRVTAEGFEKSRRVDGLPFADLTDSTIVGRLRRRKGAFNKAARLPKETKAEKAQRKAARSRNIYARTAGRALRDASTGERRTRRQEQILAAAKAANFKPLVDTGRMRNSAKARVVGESTVRWAVVDYGVPHITGGKNWRPPQRNPSVFRVINGAWVLHEKVAADIARKLIAHITKPAGGK
jgi:molybdopterin-guanine dinucleotide biosynthesis protein